MQYDKYSSTPKYINTSFRLAGCFDLQEAPLEPLMVIAGAADVLSQKGFLAGEAFWFTSDVEVVPGPPLLFLVLLLVVVVAVYF